MDRMSNGVNSPRKYSSPLRAGQAAATRHQVLSAAWDEFTTRGYAATTVARVAKSAGVSVDTLYAAVGRKPQLLREVVESAISGTDRTVPAEERDYVKHLRAAEGARAKIHIYADAVAAISPRTAPIFVALRDAAQGDADCASLDTEISSRRAVNMLKLAADLRVTGELRPGLTDQYVADIVWATAGFEHYTQLVLGRGWAPEQFGAYLKDLWMRLFLENQAIRHETGAPAQPSSR